MPAGASQPFRRVSARVAVGGLHRPSRARSMAVAGLHVALDSPDANITFAERYLIFRSAKAIVYKALVPLGKCDARPSKRLRCWRVGGFGSPVASSGGSGLSDRLRLRSGACVYWFLAFPPEAAVFPPQALAPPAFRALFYFVLLCGTLFFRPRIGLWWLSFSRGFRLWTLDFGLAVVLGRFDADFFISLTFYRQNRTAGRHSSNDYAHYVELIFDFTPKTGKNADKNPPNAHFDLGRPEDESGRWRLLVFRVRTPRPLGWYESGPSGKRIRGRLRSGMMASGGQVTSGFLYASKRVPSARVQ